MLFRKKGMPEESELVLCTVTKIYPHCVFLTLDEYENKSGMAHISEVSPGRIRNIGDYVKLGKKIICKVLKMDLEKGHIDLSLRRVSEGQRREKAEELKQEQLAEKFVELAAKQTKTDVKTLYLQIVKQVQNDYDSLYEFFEEYIHDEKPMEKLDLPEEAKEKLCELITSRIKPQRVDARAELELLTYASDGLADIQSAIASALKGSDAEVHYLGAGKYSLEVVGEDYKETENVLTQLAEAIISNLTDRNGSGSFKKIESKA